MLEKKGSINKKQWNWTLGNMKTSSSPSFTIPKRWENGAVFTNSCFQVESSLLILVTEFSRMNTWVYPHAFSQMSVLQSHTIKHYFFILSWQSRILLLLVISMALSSHSSVFLISHLETFLHYKSDSSSEPRLASTSYFQKCMSNPNKINLSTYSSVFY